MTTLLGEQQWQLYFGHSIVIYVCIWIYFVERSEREKLYRVVILSDKSRLSFSVATSPPPRDCVCVGGWLSALRQYDKTSRHQVATHRRQTLCGGGGGFCGTARWTNIFALFLALDLKNAPLPARIIADGIFRKIYFFGWWRFCSKLLSTREILV